MTPTIKAAREAWEGMVGRGETIVTTNYVVVETTAVLQSRIGLDAVRWMQDDMLSVISVEWVDNATHQRAMSAVLAGSRRGPSLVDCVGFEVIRSMGLTTVFAFDRHFCNKGFKSAA